MFSKELENLIQATLEDGILEDYEKAALVKRAQAEGVDLAELEIYINSILQKRKRELSKEQNAKQAVLDQKKKEAFGRVCPNCGKQVAPLVLKCDCGYEFTNKQVSSVALLSEKIEKIMETPLKKSPKEDGYQEEIADRYKKIRNTITMFPVPNSKEDIIEFLSLAASRSTIRGGILGTVKGRLKIAIPLGILSIIIVCIAMIALFGDEGGGLVMGLAYGALAAYGIFYFCLKKGTDVLEDNKTADVWRDKFRQVMIKGRSLRGDAEFTQQLDYYESLLNQKNTP